MSSIVRTVVALDTAGIEVSQRRDGYYWWQRTNPAEKHGPHATFRKAAYAARAALYLRRAIARCEAANIKFEMRGK